MLFRALTAVVALGAAICNGVAVDASSKLPSGFCGSHLTPDEYQAVKATFAKVFNGTAAPQLKRDLHARAPFTVPVIWNVFYDQNNPPDGNFPDSVITQSHSVVNSFFGQIGLTFQVQTVRRIPTSYNVVHGAAIGNNVERQLKQYRQGNVQTLNIYTVGQNPSTGLAGWSSFPWEYQQNPQNDGIVYDYNYLPGGRNVNYNTGKILAHEIGHWLGLFHTFQDGCNGGDLVDDTPAEASNASGCPRGRDTCPGAGADPIDNQMDYTDDTCRVRFTNGQYNRIAQQIYQYRGINLY